MLDRVDATHECEQERQVHEGVYRQARKHDDEVEAERSECLESRTGHDPGHNPEDADGGAPDHELGELHHRVEGRLEHAGQLRAGLFVQARQEVPEQDGEEDHRQHVAPGQRRERILRNDV